MKLSDIAKGRPIICRFDDPDDSHSGIVTKEPKWQEDPYDSAKEVLVVMLENKGLTYELRVRSQMVDAVRDAVAAAGEESLEVGGFLSVVHYGLRGNLKLYKATYEAPGAALEHGPEDPGDDAPLW